MGQGLVRQCSQVSLMPAACESMMPQWVARACSHHSHGTDPHALAELALVDGATHLHQGVKLQPHF